MNPTSGLLAEAAQALNRHQPDAAIPLLEQLLARTPDAPDASFLLGLAHVMQGTSSAAIPLLRNVVAQQPRHADAHMYLGCALQDAGCAPEAVHELQRACELAPGRPATWYNLGKALKQQGTLCPARQALERALALAPAHSLARIALADVHAMHGDIALAEAAYRQVLGQSPDRAEAWHGLANLKTVALDRADEQAIRAALDASPASGRTRAVLGFCLFKALDDQGRHTEAFAALHAANAAMRPLAPWHGAAEHAQVTAIAAAFAHDGNPPVDALQGREVIFIASLPRSGSTLVEQILASHPWVTGANEIGDLPQVIDDESRRRGLPFPGWVAQATPEDWARLGLDYLARTARWRTDRPRFTDKGLVNWLYVGVIRAMLPGARVVTVRRDPLETCFACYRQLFRHGMGFTYDLTDLAARWHDFHRLSRQWAASWPGHAIDLDYDQLTATPEPAIRALLAACELPFDTRCLAPQDTHRDVLSTASAAQVRRPIKPPRKYVADYRAELAGLAARLAQ